MPEEEYCWSLQFTIKDDSRDESITISIPLDEKNIDEVIEYLEGIVEKLKDLSHIIYAGVYF